MQALRSILVTGGTGSFGRAFLRTALLHFPSLQRAVVYSRDELKQLEMSEDPVFQDRRVRFFIGDVRDKERLRRALEGIEVVIHAAALKQVPAAEYNPFEAIKTNVIGAQNIIECCLDRDVRRVVALSTDKAAAPVNLYGATKLCSDKLFAAANYSKGSRAIAFSVVRYGNVLGSRGSVVPAFLKQRQSGVLAITDQRMTRFNITLEQAVDFVVYVLGVMKGGELFVPRLPSYKLTDLAEAVCPHCRKEVRGIRPGEKLHEELITESDALHAAAFERGFVILPAMPPEWNQMLVEHLKARPCPEGFRYSSGTNTDWLDVAQLRALIRAHVDPHFEPGVHGGVDHAVAKTG